MSHLIEILCSLIYLCQPGQILIIPQQHPFSIRYYRSAIGFTGGFAPAFIPDSLPLRYLSSPLHQGFWFDEGSFMTELFNMLANSFEKGDNVFIQKGLDLLLRIPGTIANYAKQANISENYLSRLVNPIGFPKKDARIILIPSFIGLKYPIDNTELCRAKNSV